jgi:hypothetical protein
LRKCGGNVCRVEFFDGRQVRGMRVRFVRDAQAGAPSVADAETCEQRDSDTASVRSYLAGVEDIYQRSIAWNAGDRPFWFSW